MAPMKAMKAMKVMRAMKTAAKSMLKAAPMKKAMKAVPMKKGMKAIPMKKAMKAVKTKAMKKSAVYEIVVTCCHSCKNAQEVLGGDNWGLLTLAEYFCRHCGGGLEIVSCSVEPTKW
jgi:hypothetical protein